MSYVIKTENLGKKYLISHQRRERYQTLRDTIMHTTRGIVQRLRHPLSPNREMVDLEELWALKDIDLEVKQGERVGLIGRNGAGKSTLLKILSRITHPSSGRVRIRGRVGSLLEVGTGFHPELTGGENIYLNGAILGMTRQEIKKKFDEIVAFAEVEKFLDTPVKRYSSGMYVRLAFAVAAHLEPEVLLVDEVLAVGDASFQKKCLGKMGEVAEEGRTVLFVSHNMVAVQNLCNRAILIEKGNIVNAGSTDQVISEYLQIALSDKTEQVWDDEHTAPGNDLVRLHRICVRPTNDSSADQITMQTPITIEIEYWHLVPEIFLSISLKFFNEQGILAFYSGAGAVNEAIWRDHPMQAGFYRSVCYIPGDLLNQGVYGVQLLIIKDRSNVVYQYDNALSFDVVEWKENRRGAWYGKAPGVVRPLLEWRTELVRIISGERLN